VKTYKVSNSWISKALHWANAHYQYISYHQNNGIEYPHEGFKHYLAIGTHQVIKPSLNCFHELEKVHNNKWLFGYFGYDLKNEIEGLDSCNVDHLGFPELSFFEPEILFELNGNDVKVLIGPETVIETIDNHSVQSIPSSFESYCADFDKDTYTATVKKLIEHIIEGDFYEINFCHGFFGDFQSVDTVDTFLKLNGLSPKPFSCFQKFENHVIICASPERFLKRVADKLISQPIKGTRPRSQNQEIDEKLKNELRTDEKELAENMMIVDLVRNDLAKSSISGSVVVEEMFGIYSFAQVHQMISTVTSTLDQNTSSIEAIKNAFPMGSMTGAPKRIVMESIDLYEKSKRGAFSGASGYFKPNGDFDFNVLIRSLFLNIESKKYGFYVGSAITFDAIAELEYEECFIKASALMKLLDQ